MIANIFGEPLERIDSEAFLAALNAMSVETGRLDFKRHDVNREDVAWTAAAMANSDGGIIAIGFVDPKGGRLQSSGSIDISNSALTAWYAAIHARVHPPMSFEVRGYAAPSRTEFLIIRIQPNQYAPHEFVANNRERDFPVRRGSTTGRLTLAEINALLARRAGSPPQSWLAHDPPQFPVRPGLSAARFFGVCFTSYTAMPARRVLSQNDTLAFGRIITTVVGSKLSPALQPLTLREGEGYFDVNPKSESQGRVILNFGLPTRIIHIRADGEVTVRFHVAQEPENYFYELLKILLIGHLTASEVFNYLRIGPRGSGAVGVFLGEGRRQTTPFLPAQFEDRFDVDFSTQTFAETFAPTVMLCLREEAGPPDEEAVLGALDDTYRKYLGATDLRKYWR